MRVPNSVVLPVGTHVDCCREGEVEEKRSDIMSKIAAMLVERKNNLAHFINNLEDSEEPEFYVDQWERLKEMENHMLTVGSIIVDLLQLSGELGKLAGFGVLTQARLVGYLMP